MTVQLFTWNLHKRQRALNAFVQYIAGLSKQGEAFIAAVQECTEDASAVAAMVDNEGGKVYARGNGTMSIFCSTELEEPPLPRGTVGGRLVLTRATLSGRRFAVINYHGHAQGLDGSPDPTERGGIASEARWIIDDHAQRDPAVILGDFNADWDSSEITSLYCFSFAQDPVPRSQFSHQRERSARKLAQLSFPPGCRGTFWWKSGTQGPRWRTFDFIAAGPGVSVETNVLDILNGDTLRTEEKDMPFSDHLPVAGRMTLT